MLEIGCGTAPLVVAARGRWERMVGVDIALRWLVVARKRLAEAGMDVPLVCACAEALPFRDASFDRVVGDAVIENVSDQPRALGEAARVLRPGGRVHLATTNRFSLGPDPATGIWAAGWLPTETVAARMRRRGGVPPVRSLLSAPALRRLLRGAGLARPRLSLPTFPAAQVASLPPLVRRLVGGYHLAARLPLSRHLLFLVGPKLQASAEKPAR
jgi:SAM-dependent methyltransferase